MTVSLAVIAVTALLAAATGALTAMIAGALLLTSDALLGWNRFVDRAPGGRVLVQVTNHAAHVGFVLWLTS